MHAAGTRDSAAIKERLLRFHAEDGTGQLNEALVHRPAEAPLLYPVRTINRLAGAKCGLGTLSKSYDKSISELSGNRQKSSAPTMHKLRFREQGRPGAEV